MRIYLDASVLIPLFIEEARTGEAHNALAGKILIVSDFAMAEFSSGIARRVGMDEISQAEGVSIFAIFDTWITRAAHRESLSSGYVLTAMGFVRRTDLALRTPDAINLAIAQCCGARLLTFDAKQAEAARQLGVEVVRCSPMQETVTMFKNTATERIRVSRKPSSRRASVSVRERFNSGKSGGACQSGRRACRSPLSRASPRRCAGRSRQSDD